MYDLIIIGAGPAGLTAGLYAGRFRLETLILERLSIGGQIILSPHIENFPGFPGGIAAEELAQRINKQVQELVVGIEMEEALELRFPSGEKDLPFSVVTKEKTLETRSLIIATGAQPKRLGVKGEELLTARGVSYCGTCDGPLFKDKDIVVVGAGDRALEEAIFLSSYAKSVTLIHRRNELRGSRILQEKATSNPRIKFVLESTVEEIVGEKMVEGVKLKNVRAGSLCTLSCQGVFIFVGIRPNTDLVKDKLQLDNLGFIITDSKQRTSLAGVFACGDCCHKPLYQVVTACSEGAVAADTAHKYLL